MTGLMDPLRRLDQRMTHVMAEAAIPLLRINLAITYLWFDAGSV